jgi:hypothetical protein
LEPGAQAAEYYAIESGACPSDPQSVHPASPRSIATALTFADFGISLNVTLSPEAPLERCLILAHCDMENQSVCSFQMFDVTFN